MRETPGFLGTEGSLASDITLLIYLFLLVPGMLLGFYFARRKKYEPNHKLTMTTVVIVNWILIALVMIVGYTEGVLPFLDPQYAAQFAGDPRIALPTIHGITGGIAQLLATYLALRMWFEKRLPQWLMVKRIKVYMRFTLSLWLVTAALGALIYFSWYVNPLQARAPQPASTVEPGATVELALAGTEEVTAPAPAATAEATLDPHASHFPAPLRTQEVRPGATAEVTPPGINPISTQEVRPGATPEVAFTEELTDDEIDATQDAARDAFRATERAARDAARATEDARDDAEDAARDAARATERAARDAARATEDALEDDD